MRISSFKFSSMVVSMLLMLCFTACKRDQEPPVLRLKGAETLRTSVNLPVAEPGFIAFDKEDLDLVDQVVISGNVDITQAGTYQRIYTVTDAAGNSAQAVRTIVVEMDINSLVGTFRSSNGFGSCSGYGTTVITIESAQNKILKFSPAVGYFGGSNNAMRMAFNGATAPQLIVTSCQLPCSYYNTGGTGTGRVFNNGDSIHVFFGVYSVLNGSYTYFSADYVRI
jgi:hypothetical protein